jgi:hypothetical protein
MPTNLTGSTIASTFDQLLHVDDGPTATEKTVYSGTGVATALKVGTNSVSVDNIQLDGNTIQATTGNLTLGSNIAFGSANNARTALGLGTMATQNAGAVAITGGSITNVTFTGSFSGITSIDSTSFSTSNAAAGTTLTGNTLSADGTDTNIDINITPKGTGEVNISKVDIDGGAIDGTPIGASAASTIKGTTVQATTSIGYPTGTGGAVTQLTSKSTGVTLDKICGQITMNNATLNRVTSVTFTLTNSFIAATDVIVVNIASGATAGAYTITVEVVAAGSCNISLHNLLTGTDLSEAVVLNFAVIKAVNA